MHGYQDNFIKQMVASQLLFLTRGHDLMHSNNYNDILNFKNWFSFLTKLVGGARELYVTAVRGVRGRK